MEISKIISLFQILLFIIYVIGAVLAFNQKEVTKKRLLTKVSNFSVLILIILFPIKSKFEPLKIETNPKKIIQKYFEENELSYPTDYEEQLEYKGLKQAMIKSGDEKVYVYIKDNKVAKLMLLPSRYFIYNTLPDEEPVKLNKDLLEERSEFRQMLSSWDNSHPVQEKLVKMRLNYPDSYKHVLSDYIDLGNYYVISTIFKAKNGFGMEKEHIIKTKYPLDKNEKLEILEYN